VITSAVGEGVFGQLLKNKPANVLGNPDTRHSQTFILDFGRALVELGQADRALGKTWLVPNPPAITTREFVSRICAQLGRQPRLRSAGRTLLSLMGLFDARLRELKEMMYEFEHDFVIDDSAYRRTFGDHDTAVDDAISQTVAWYSEYYTG
jgi:nucleoside-diphosphate-sugar epimerase